jgi:hypothetical protein
MSTAGKHEEAREQAAPAGSLRCARDARAEVGMHTDSMVSHGVSVLAYEACFISAKWQLCRPFPAGTSLAMSRKWQSGS